MSTKTVIMMDDNVKDAIGVIVDYLAEKLQSGISYFWVGISVIIIMLMVFLAVFHNSNDNILNSAITLFQHFVHYLGSVLIDLVDLVRSFLGFMGGLRYILFGGLHAGVQYVMVNYAIIFSAFFAFTLVGLGLTEILEKLMAVAVAFVVQTSQLLFSLKFASVIFPERVKESRRISYWTTPADRVSGFNRPNDEKNEVILQQCVVFFIGMAMFSLLSAGAMYIHVYADKLDNEVLYHSGYRVTNLNTMLEASLDDMREYEKEAANLLYRFLNEAERISENKRGNGQKDWDDNYNYIIQLKNYLMEEGDMDEEGRALEEIFNELVAAVYEADIVEVSFVDKYGEIFVGDSNEYWEKVKAGDYYNKKILFRKTELEKLFKNYFAIRTYRKAYASKNDKETLSLTKLQNLMENFDEESEDKNDRGEPDDYQNRHNIVSEINQIRQDLRKWKQSLPETEDIYIYYVDSERGALLGQQFSGWKLQIELDEIDIGDMVKDLNPNLWNFERAFLSLTDARILDSNVLYAAFGLCLLLNFIIAGLCLVRSNMLRLDSRSVRKERIMGFFIRQEMLYDEVLRHTIQKTAFIAVIGTCLFFCDAQEVIWKFKWKSILFVLLAIFLIYIWGAFLVLHKRENRVEGDGEERGIYKEYLTETGYQIYRELKRSHFYKRTELKVNKAGGIENGGEALVKLMSGVKYRIQLYPVTLKWRLVSEMEVDILFYEFKADTKEEVKAFLALQCCQGMIYPVYDGNIRVPVNDREERLVGYCFTDEWMTLLNECLVERAFGGLISHTYEEDLQNYVD